MIMSKKHHATEEQHHAAKEHHAEKKSCSCDCTNAGLWGALAVIFLVTAVTLVFSVMTNSTVKDALKGVTAPAPSIPDDAAPTAPVQINVEGQPFLGPSNAKVTVVEFSDFQCPFCGAAAGTHAELIARFKGQDPTWTASVPKLEELAKAGKIKLVFMQFPLSSIHENAEKAAEASECAFEQNKFWEYQTVLFQHQETLTADNLKQYAKDLGLDATKFDTCLDSGKMAAVVQKDFQAGQAVGVRGTPAFFVNGQLVSGAQPWSAFEPLINTALAS
jgi:protein-disulfide isomerase